MSLIPLGNSEIITVPQPVKPQQTQIIKYSFVDSNGKKESYKMTTPSPEADNFKFEKIVTENGHKGKPQILKPEDFATEATKLKKYLINPPKTIITTFTNKVNGVKDQLKATHSLNGNIVNSVTSLIHKEKGKEPTEKVLAETTNKFLVSLKDLQELKAPLMKIFGGKI